MSVNRGWGFSVVIAAIVGIGIGVLIAVLAGEGSGSRLLIGGGVGLLIGGGLLAIFDRSIARKVNLRAVPSFDPETGERLAPSARSSFVALSLEVWTLVLVGLGVLIVGVGVVAYLSL